MMSDQNGWGMIELCVALLVFGLLAVPLYVIILQEINHSKDHQVMTIAALQIHNFYVYQTPQSASLLAPLWRNDNANLILGHHLSPVTKPGFDMCLSWRANTYVCL